MKLHGALLVLVVGCGSAAELPAPKQEAVRAAESASEANPQVFAVDSDPYGTTMMDWAIDWMRWLYSIPAATNPNLVRGVPFDVNQPDRVFFIADGPREPDVIPVPRHKAIGLMLSQINNTFPCPDPSFHPAPGQSLFDFLSAGLTKINDDITVLDVSMDGLPVRDAFRYRFTSQELFLFTGDPSLAAVFDPCVTGTPQPAVVDDLFLLFKPLAPGQHTLVTHIENRDGNVFDRTRTIAVE